MAPLLAPRFRVIAYDARGHGRSAKPSAGYGLRETSNDAAAVIRQTELLGAVVLGHSWGAGVALEAAARHRTLVRGIVMVDGGFGTMRSFMEWKEARVMLAPPALAGMPAAAYLAGARKGLAGKVRWTPEVERIVMSMVFVNRRGEIRPRLSRPAHMRILRNFWEQDTHSLLRSLTIPALVIGARETHTSPGQRAFMAAKRSAAASVRSIGGGVRFEWMEGIHDLPLQRPKELARRVARFVEQCQPKAASKAR